MHRKFAVIGHPLGHSLSPLLHRQLFRLAGRTDEYVLWDLDPSEWEDPAGLRRRLEALAGFNITIPYKTDIIPLLDEVSENARFYGAVNVVDRRDGKLVGYNTDCDGFCLSLQQEGALDALSGTVCVVGVGGAGRMMALEAARRGADLTAAVRDPESTRSRQFAEEAESLGLRCRMVPISSLQGGWDLLINATSVGMFPHTDAMAPPPAALRDTRFVFDAVYNPADTLLLRRAQEAGCRPIRGMPMLVLQGAEAHRIWDGDKYDPADIGRVTQRLYQALQPDKPGI